MITRDMLEKYAKDLMFEMNEEEYATLEKEFDIILKQMDLIANIENINDIQPMTFPFDLELDDSFLRSDEACNSISFNDMKVNVKDMENDMVKVPKVVEE